MFAVCVIFFINGSVKGKSHIVHRQLVSMLEDGHKLIYCSFHLRWGYLSMKHRKKKTKQGVPRFFSMRSPPSINSHMFGSFWTVPPSTVTALNDRDQVDWLQFFCSCKEAANNLSHQNHIGALVFERGHLCLSLHFRCGNRPNMHYDYARSIVSCACHMQTIAPAIRGILGAPRGWPWTKNGRKAVPDKMAQRYSEQWLL